MKVGDKVRVIKDTYLSAFLNTGATGIIVTVNDEGDCYGVIVDGAPQPASCAYLNGFPAWAYRPRELEVIQ